MKKNKILIIEDENKISEVVQAYLEKNNYATLVASDGTQGVDFFKTEHPDMVILDLMLPYISGEEICKIIRKESKIPIIMLTAKASEDDKIEGLSLGADDYITKPFSPRELVARVDSLFRRCSYGISPFFTTFSWNAGDLAADYETHTIYKQGEPVNLTPNEFKLFSVLSKRPNKIFTRDELIEIALGIDFNGYDRTIDSHIKNLRSKIETDTANPVYILTVRGTGYKFGGNKA